jgi:hypothetical protein
MDDLTAEPPPSPDRLAAVLARAGRARDRWRIAVVAAAASVVARTGAALLVPRSQGPSDQLYGDAVPSGSSVTPGPGPTPTCDTTATPGPGPSPSAAQAPLRTVVATASFLGDEWVAGAFGDGHAPAVATTTEPRPGLVRSCYHTGVLSTAPPERMVARSWSWPGEVVVAEVLAREPSEAAAAARAATCGDPTARDFDPDAAGYASDAGAPSVHRVVVAGGVPATVAVVPRSLDTSVYGVTRVEDGVLVLTWRQSGSAPDAVSRMRTALEAALSRATGSSEGAAPPGPDFSVPQAVRELPTRSDLPRALPWVHDARDSDPALACGSSDVRTAERPVSRTWLATRDGSAPEATPGVTVRVGRAVDETAAEQGLAACRQGYEGGGSAVDDTPGGTVGDASFLVTPDAETLVLVCRSGVRYVEVRVRVAGSYDEVRQLAEAVVRHLAP